MRIPWPRRLTALLGGAFLAFSAFAAAPDSAAPPSAAATGAGAAALLKISGPISPATADYVERSLRRAARDGAPLVILQIDTPGGLDSATRVIIQHILAAPMPVVTWVAPSGARAASAGAYIAYASHVSAMAPGTNLGAATPVQMGGMPGTAPAAPGGQAPAAPPQPKASQPGATAPEAPPPADAMGRKIVNDSAAYLRSLAQMRGRNADWADQAVRAGVSLSAVEAVAQGVVDLIAADLPALLAAVHGRKVKMGDGRSVQIASQGLRVVTLEPDWRTNFLSIVANPTVAYMLLLLGIYGIYFELTSPGIGLPGVAGSIALLVGMFALQMLPVNYAGVALIVLGFALLVAEAMVPSFGVLGIGGAIAFVVGSVILFDTDVPGMGIPPGLIATVAVVNILFIVVVLRMALRARKRPVVSGSEELPGTLGSVLDHHADELWVRVHGERWRATAALPLQAGQPVRVTGRSGLVLQVEPLDASGA